MMFLVSLIALLTERFFHWGHLREWRWWDKYIAWARRKCPAHLPSFINYLFLLPPILIVAVLAWTFTDVYYGLLSLIFSVAVVLYTMGPANFWQVFHAGEFEQIAANSDSKSNVDAILFSAVFDGVFAVLFWFWVLGPMGAVLYRVVAQTSRKTKNSGPLSRLIVVRYWLDWLPVRIFGLLFALAGHFVTVFNIWKKYALKHPGDSSKFLVDCGRGALSEKPSLPVSGDDALSLLDRVLVITLVILSLLVLAL